MKQQVRYFAVDPRGTRCGSLEGYRTKDAAERYAQIIWAMAGCDTNKPSVRELFNKHAVETRTLDVSTKP